MEVTSSVIKVMIVDDEASIRDGLQTVVPWNELGMQVVCTCQDGQEALLALREFRPDIVLTDIRMPVMDGLELIARAREQFREIRFVILSGYDDFRYAQAAMRHGVRGYLLKPVRQSELMQELEKLRQELVEAQAQAREHEDSHQALQTGLAATRERFFSRLLQGGYRYEDDLLADFRSLGMENDFDRIQALVFQYEYPEGQDITGSGTDHALRRRLTDNIRQLLGSRARTVCLETGGRSVAAICGNAIFQSLLSEEDMERLTEGLPQGVFTLYAGAGTHENGLSRGMYTYRAALDALSYRIFENGKSLFQQGDICQTPPAGPAASDMDNSVLTDAICCGNQALIRLETGRFFSRFSTPGQVTPAYIRGMCIYLVMDVQKGLSPYVGKDALPGDPYETINSLPFLSQLQNWMLQRFETLSSCVRQSGRYRQDAVTEKAKAYIQDNIFRKIRAEDVAAHVNLSESYFTAYFKEKTGDNFLNYVLNLKIDHARALLRTGTKSVSEIAFLLGYEDYRSFNRLFKKITGQTPSDYRQQFAPDNRSQEVSS